jgi:hypothetical protein
MIVSGALAVVAFAGCAGVFGYVLAAPIIALGEVVFGAVEAFALRGRCFAIGEIRMTITIDGRKGDTR